MLITKEFIYGNHISINIKINVLSPSSDVFYCDINSKSLVLKIVYGQNSILYCADIDFETENDGCVTVRDRDTMEQIRIKVEEVESYIASKIDF